MKSKQPTVDLSDAIGLSKIYTDAMYKISQFFTGQDIYAQDLQQYLRRQEAIRLLKDCVESHIILEDSFGLQVWKTKSVKIYLDKYKVRYYYEQLFKDSHLAFQQIIETYHNNPGNILDRYRKGNIILKD